MKVKIAGMVCVLLLFSVGVARADKVTFTVDSFGSTGGGEFIFRADTPLTGTVHGAGYTWATFCLETNETIQVGAQYDAALNTQAIAGGVGGGSPDPLDNKTAWLYDQFQAGTLAGYNYVPGPGRVASANALQDAIWFIENEIAVLPAGQATTFFNAAVAANPQNLGTIRVLNLTTPGPNGGVINHQDILVNIVPLPAAAWTGLALLAGLGLVRFVRHRRQMA